MHRDKIDDQGLTPAERLGQSEFRRGWEDGVAAERERCAKIADELAKGQTIEIGGRTLLLGSMTMNPCDAQKATAEAIAAVIRQQ